MNLKLILQPNDLVLKGLDRLNKSDNLLIFCGELAMHHEKLLGFNSAGAWWRNFRLYEKIVSLLDRLFTARRCDRFRLLDAWLMLEVGAYSVFEDFFVFRLDLFKLYFEHLLHLLHLLGKHHLDLLEIHGGFGHSLVFLLLIITSIFFSLVLSVIEFQRNLD